MKKLKLAYLGGGSRNWARVFMNDLALTEELGGQIALYDTDLEAARLNQRIGTRISAYPQARSHWEYVVAETLEEALTGADFVACSILPGTLEDMAADVHLPEQYGIFQSVGDTVGPGGVLRAMRTVPIYEQFARAIQRCCPNAWVINLTNPMTLCVKTLYDLFPQVKAFGCCHEVFHAQEFLCCVLQQVLGVPRPNRQELTVDTCGINHFTWITRATWQGRDVLELLPAFLENFYDQGYCEWKTREPWDFRDDPFCCGNKVKMDLFRRFGVLAAAGDRHLVEFLPRSWYLGSRQAPEQWLYHLTTVDYRKALQQQKIQETQALAQGLLPLEIQGSDEELIQLMKAIAGLGPVISNANTINRGQMSQLPLGAVVETNHVFADDSVQPIVSRPLPPGAAALVERNYRNQEETYAAIRDRDLNRLEEVFLAQPLCEGLSLSDGRSLFRQMVQATRTSLAPYYCL